MLERGTLSILCTFQISSLTCRPLLPTLKVSVASKTELCNKHASETVCEQPCNGSVILKMPVYFNHCLWREG